MGHCLKMQRICTHPCAKISDTEPGPSVDTRRGGSISQQAGATGVGIQCHYQTGSTSDTNKGHRHKQGKSIEVGVRVGRF